MTSAFLASVVDHLWQSTLFGALVWIVTLALRRNSAAVRYRLWMAASLKFLVPCSALVSIGARFAWRGAPAAAPPTWPVVVEEVFSPQVRAVAAVSGAAAVSHPSAIPAAIIAIWIVGSAGVLLAWWRQWRTLRAALGRADSTKAVVSDGMTVLLSPDRVEPGLVGVVRPVLLLPESIHERVPPAGLDAILAHEACHLRRRDNLTAALHMAVEAIFWFHPGVWWIESRLVDERERACDEAVLVSGAEPRAYAEAILRVCRYYVESPSIAAAGVTGANLKRRIESIVTHRRARPLSRWMVGTIALFAMCAVAGPIALGAVRGVRAEQPSDGFFSAGAGQAAIAATGPLSFQAASIKLDKSTDGSRSAGFQPGGRFVARNMPLRNLVAVAYGEPAPLPLLRVIGGPDWLDTERFDIEASAGAPQASVAPGFSTAGERMLQSLLAERFRLVAHREKRDLPVFALVPVRADRALAPGVVVSSSTDCAGGIVTATCGFGFVPEPNPHVRHYRARSVTMEGLAKNLGSYINLGIDRLVVDQTGLSGAFSFDLEFAPPAAGGGPPDNGVSIFTALQEQVGLKLESARAPVDVIVIDHAERLADDAAQVAPPPAAPRPRVTAQPPPRPAVSARPQTGTITGTVTDSFSNEPLAGVVVEVATEDPPNNPRTVTTDENGAFVVDGLAPDTYIVTLHHVEYQTYKREGLQVSAGATATILAALRFGGPIRD